MAFPDQSNGSYPCYDFSSNDQGYSAGSARLEPHLESSASSAASQDQYYKEFDIINNSFGTPHSPNTANYVPLRPATMLPQTANRTSAFPSPQQQPRWNAAQLLNPRKFGQAAQQTFTNSPNQNGLANNNTSSQLTFQFDSPGGSPRPVYPQTPPRNHYSDQNGGSTPNRSDYTGYANRDQNGMAHRNGNGHTGPTNGFGNGDLQMNGMGHMLERIHNVADRSMIPHKRRKIQDDRVDDQRKAEFNGGGKNGVIGEYMREQREEGRKENGTSNTFSVALDDDDDVQIVPDADEKEVCYGRIEGVTINAFKVPTAKDGAIAMREDHWPAVKIILRRRCGEKTNVIHVVDATREIIGCIDAITAIGLTPLLDSKFGIRTAARILTRPKMPDDPEPGSTGQSRKYNLDLNIYGRKKYALQIGRFLAQKHLILQNPLLLEAGTILYNPHRIEKPPQPPSRTTYTSYGGRQQGVARSTEEIRNDVLGVFDTLTRSDQLPELEADPRITTPLLTHQKQGLYFMIDKEKDQTFGTGDKNNSSLWKVQYSSTGSRTFFNVITGQEEHKCPPQALGGILADMMGLGKTLLSLSLIVQSLDTEAVEWAKLEPCSQDSRELCPTRKGKKAALPKIEQTPLVLNAKTTLLVCPLSTMQNWEEQIKQHIVPGALKYYIYYGTNKIKDPKKLAEFDLIICTYGAVNSEFGSRSKQKEGLFPLEQINWFRIVLDEAHVIREQSTQTCKAICRLAANRRWAVTGTPVQNRLEDLGALMAFLRIKPFDEKGGFAQHIMAPFKNCDPEILPKLRLLVDSITLRRLKDRINLPQRYDTLVKLEFTPEERAIYDVFAKNADDRVKVIVGQRDAKLGGRSYVHILQSILRLRLICAHGKDLLNEEDLKVMEGLSKDSAIDLDSDDDEDNQGLSSRQAYDMYNLMKQTGADNCIRCAGKIGSNEAVDFEGDAKDQVLGYMTPCFHIICPACIVPYKASAAESAQGRPIIVCSICQAHINLTYFPLKMGGVEDEEDGRMKSNGRQSKDLSNYSGPHTKTRALIADLIKSREESALLPVDKPIKSVVFSTWTAHLDLIQLALTTNSMKYVRLDGKMTRPARNAAMEHFKDDPSITVILVSITAGGLGLNLTTANKVYVMEPQYNPAAEAQAVDRVHRLGQTREVTTVRYVMNDSFEEKMLELQEKKKKLAHLSMDSDGRGKVDRVEASRKRLEDLRSLFK